MGFYLVPFRQPNPPTRFLSITGHHFGMACLDGSKVNIQHMNNPAFAQENEMHKLLRDFDIQTDHLILIRTCYNQR